MKVAILSESPADEAALRILLDAMLGQATESISLSLRSRGWPAVRTLLSPILKQLHYHSDADGLVLVVDSDESPMHDEKHGVGGRIPPDCRVCQLWNTVMDVRRVIRLVPGRVHLPVAIGLAVPAIESWYLCGADELGSEEAWAIQRTREQLREGRLELKRRAYGTDRRGLAVETECAVRHARRIAADLPALERAFPCGFGTLMRDLRSWQIDSSP